MALTNIEYGSLASSETMNTNFQYLDNRISTVVENNISANAVINSNIATLNSSISSLSSSVNGSIANINNSIDELEGKIDEISFLPDYTKAFSIPSPYTATMDGYVYAYAWCASGTEGASMYIDDFQIILNGGLNNREGAHGPSALAPISKGATFTTSGNIQIRTFIPMKGAN